MNRIYKVIWNEALNCFTAVGEYAKGRGKSSKSSVSANATINTTPNLSSTQFFRLSTIAIGLLAAGFGIQANAIGTENHHDGDYSHNHGSQGVHTHTSGNNSHNNNSDHDNPEGSITLNFEGDNATTITRSNGETLNILGGATGPLTTGNIGVFGIGDTLTVQLAESIDLGANGSLKTGNTLIDNSGVKIVAINAANNITLSSNGLNNGNNKIINVDNGDVTATSKDAVNGSQLYRLANVVKDNKTKYYSVDSTAIGNANNDGATGYNAMAMGGNAKATGSQTIAIGSSEFGQQTMASGEQSIAIGANVVSRGASSIAIGGDDLNFASKTNIDGSPLSPLNGGTVNEAFKSYVGKDLVETNQYDVNTEAGGAASIAIGAKSLSKGDLSTAVGIHSNTSGTASSAFGVGASASKDGSVSLGAGSTTATSASSEKTMTVGGVVYDIAGNVIDDKGMLREGAQVSVGVVGSERQIKNVAGGAVTAASTDAVNGSQLYATNEAVGSNTTTINKGFALQAADGNTVQKPLGQAVEVVGSNSNIDTRVENGKIEVELNDNLNLGTTGSVSTGNLLNGTTVNGLGVVTGGVLTGVTTVSGTGVTVTGGSIFNPTNATLTSNGLTILNGPSITKSGVNAGNKKVINVDDGAVSLNSKDAINGGQLFQTNQQVTSNTSNISTNTTNIGTNADNIAKGINFNVNDASSGGTLKKTFALGEEIKFDTDSNLTTTALSSADGIALGLSPTLTGLTSADFGGVSISTTGINANDTQITGVKSGGNTVTNAANIGDVQMAAAGARTKVLKGTNVTSVDFSTDSDTGQDVYTINANGSTASAGSSAVTVKAGDKNIDTNITDYQVDLSEGSKASLVKADSAMQTVVTQINGAEVKTLDKDNNTANFINGDNIVLTADNGSIKVATAADLVSTSLTTGTTVVNNDGVTFTGGANQTVRLSNGGLDNGGNQITNVADGSLDNDAVNFGQLRATTTTIDKGLDFNGDMGTTVNRKLGDKLTVKGGATVVGDLSNGNNVGVVADGTSTLTVKLSKDLTGLNSANFGSGVSISANGLNNGGNKITNVAEATTGKDAVNFDQLSATNSIVAKGIKIGDGNSVNDQQFALGDTINVTGDSNITTMASATGVQVKLNNQLNLGNEGSMQIGNSIMNSNGFTFTDNGPGRTVRLSSSGLDNGFNRITNVAAGIADTDAATVGQLNATTFALDQGWGLTAQGDVATMIKQGSAIDLNSSDGNIRVSRSADNNVSPGLRAAAPLAGANDISFDLNPDLNVDSITAGDTIINSNGLTIAGGPSVTKAGINAADTKITNVANGAVSVGSKDAINGGQLYAQGSGISSIIGGETVYNPVDGTFTNSNIGGTGQNSIDGAIASIKQGEIVINENIQTNTTNIQTNTTNIATNKTNIDTNTTNIKVNKDKIDAGLNFGADSGATINKPVGDGSVLNFTGGNNITTTAAGSSIKFDLNGNISIDSVKTGNTTVNNNGVSIVGGPSMTASGINAAGNKITDVADGMAPRDAVNFGQLSALDKRLDDNMNQLGYKIGEVEDDANAGISAAMAMSSLPQAYIAGKSLIGGGIGTYNGESAVAIGFSKLSNDGRWVIKVNGTADTQGNAGGSIGAGFHFD